MTKVNGHFSIECRDKNGKLKWTEKIKNAVTNEGLTKMLNVMFGSGSHPKIATWYIGLIDNAGTPTLAPTTDTHASHSGWTEAQGYNVLAGGSTRGVWVTADLTTTQTMTNSGGTAVAFTMTGGATIYGIFITSVSVKGSTSSGTGNIIYSEAAFSGTQAVVNGDILNIIYNSTLS